MAESKAADLNLPKVVFGGKKTDGLSVGQLGDLARLVEEWLKKLHLLVCYLGLEKLELVLGQRVTGAPQKKNLVEFRGQIGAVGKTIAVKAQAGGNGERYIVNVPVPPKYATAEEFAQFVVAQLEVFKANAPAAEADASEDLQRFNGVVQKKAQELQQLKEALELQRRAMEDQKRARSGAQEQMAAAEQQLERLQATIAQCRARFDKLTEQMGDAEAALRQGEQSIAAAEQELETLQAERERYLRLSQELSDLSPELQELLLKK